MKIVEIREKTTPISSPIRNADIDFSKMTLSLVKKKIGGASLDEDLRRIDSILSVLGDGQKLTVATRCH